MEQVNDNFSKGHTQIPHWLFQCLLLLNLSKRELKVVLLIIRLTYGCQKKWAKIIQRDLRIIGVGETHAQEVKERTMVNNNLQELYNSTQKQIDDLLDMRLRKFITDEEYQKKKELLLLEKNEINNKLQNTERRADDWLDLCEKTFEFATYAHIWFKEGTNEQKRSILHALGSNLIIKDEILLLQLRKPFAILMGMKEKYQILLDMIEPTLLLDTPIQNEYLRDTIPSLLPSMDSNHDKRIQSPLSYH